LVVLSPGEARVPVMDELEFNTDVDDETYQPPPGLGLAVVTQVVGQLGGYVIAGPVGGMALARGARSDQTGCLSRRVGGSPPHRRSETVPKDTAWLVLA